ncbi:MAG: hypothetical protein HY900_35745 [Deltaproteobacteria bacterium]|nr:hypothetical protein [Deltaproteobacteria bacterium]
MAVHTRIPAVGYELTAARPGPRIDGEGAAMHDDPKHKPREGASDDEQAPLAKVLPMYLSGRVVDENGEFMGHISYRRGLPRHLWPTPEQQREQMRSLQRLLATKDEDSERGCPVGPSAGVDRPGTKGS